MPQLSTWKAVDWAQIRLERVLYSARPWSLVSVYRRGDLAAGNLVSEQTLLVMKALLAAWMLWACLVVVLLLVLLIRQGWSALLRQSHCAWCWKMVGIMRWYPCHWSSTICRHHARQVRAQSAARHAYRLSRQAEG